MKQALSGALLVCLLLGLCACTPAEEAQGEIPMERYEAYAEGTTGTYEFADSQHIARIAVLAPEDMEALLYEQAGDQSHMGLAGAEAIVVDYSAEAAATYRVYLVDGGNKVLYSLNSGEPAAATPAAAETGGKSLAELRQEYARLSVDLDNYDAALAAPLSEEALALQEELGDACFLDLRYLALEREDGRLATRADSHLAPLYECGLYLAERESAEGRSDGEIALRCGLELARRDLMRDMLTTKEAVRATEDAALAVLGENEELIAALKEDAGEDYMEDIRFYQLCLESEALQNYSTYLRTLAAQEELLAIYDEAMTLPEAQSAILFDGYSERIENRSEQYRCRIVLSAALADYEAFCTQNAQTLADYEAAAKAIRDQYTNKDYETDIEYLKLQIINESLLEGKANREAAVAAAEEELRAALYEAGEIEAEYAEQLAAEVLRAHKAEEEPRLRAFLTEQALALVLDEAGVYADEETALAGFVEMSEDFVAKMDEARAVKVAVSTGSSSGGSYSSSGSSYSSGNLCWQAGCTNRAVTSGDSVYCSIHSNKCAGCGQYIDGDAFMCISCITAALQ